MYYRQSAINLFCEDYQTFFSTVYWFCKLSQTVKRMRKMEDQIWRDLLFQSSTLSEDKLATVRPRINVSMSICAFEQGKRTRFCADQKKEKKKGMIRYDTRGKHTMQNTSESLLLTKCLTVESDRRFSSFTFSDPLAWDGWGELVTTVRDPWLILTTLWL